MKNIFFIVLTLLIVSCSAKTVDIVGKPAPAFILKTFGGETIEPGSLKGKPVLLYFFASW